MENNEVNGTGLKNKVMTGLMWTFGERIIAQGISFIVSIVLARILLPEEYGTVSIILVFINIANVFVANGFGESLIRKNDSNETDFSTVFYCSFLFACIIYLLLFFMAPYIAGFYNLPLLAPLLRILALKIPISSISTIQHAYVSKYMIFRKFFFSTLGGTIVSGLIGIFMAYRGFGVWALVFQYLINTIIDTVILFVTVPWHPHKLFNIKSARYLIGYGWKLTISGLINQLYSESRSLIIGKMYSSTELAYYNKGIQFPSLIINNVDSSIGKVVFPAMTKVAVNTVHLKSISRKALKTTSYIIFPLMIGLFVVSKPLIRLLLTDKWLFSIPFLQCGCIYYMCQPIQTTNWQIIKAVGRSDLCLKLELFKKSIGIVIILITMNYGVFAIAAGNAGFAVISMLINIIPNKKIIEYSVLEQFKDLMPAALLSICMGILIYPIIYLPINSFIILGIQVLVGVLIYICGSILFKIEIFFYLKKMITQFLRKNC